MEERSRAPGRAVPRAQELTGHGGDGAGAQAAASGIWTAETARGTSAELVALCR